MVNVSYVTSNMDKFSNAQKLFASFGIDLGQEIIKLHEIQAAKGEEIALNKIRDAYAECPKPLFVNDASWEIPALNGFPGPYMKFIANWFTVDDFLALLAHKKDRTIILRDVIAYKDAHNEKVFVNEVRGTLLTSPQGETNGPFITKLISFVDGKSLAEVRSEGFTDRELPLWHEFVGWLKDTGKGLPHGV